MTRHEQMRYRKMVKKRVENIYGLGPASAWSHMSEQQRSDAMLAQAAHIVLIQADSVASKLTLADAQELLRAGANLEG